MDRILGGGIPARQVLLVAGQPGSGKTLLASQIAFAQAARGVPVLLATAASEPHTKILESLQGFSFFNRERVGREMFLLSVYPWLRKGMREAREMLLSSVRERKARLLVLDGLRSLRDVWRDEVQIREFLSEVGVGLASNDCTGLFTLEAAPERILELPEAATVDGVMTLAFESVGMSRARRLEVVKVRGRNHLTGRHSAMLGPDGFTLSPRLEALEVEAARAQWQPGEGRAGFGIDTLDRFLGGGLPRGGVTALMGESGSGKTLLAAAWARAANRASARTFFVTLQEHAESLRARAAEAGFELPAGPEFTLDSPPPLSVDPDAMAHRVLDRATALEAQAVVIDGAEVIDVALDPPSRRHDFWFAFARCLGRSGRDVLLTFSGAPAGHAPLSSVFDHVLRMTVADEDGALVRRLRVHKSGPARSPETSWRFSLQEAGSTP